MKCDVKCMWWKNVMIKGSVLMGKICILLKEKDFWGFGKFNCNGKEYVNNLFLLCYDGKAIIIPEF